MAKRILVGDILAIPLGDGRFAFGRVLEDASIGVYQYSGESKLDAPSPATPYAFVVGVYRDVLTSGEWPRVARIPFGNEEESWPPPYAVRDVISGGFSIYFKGRVRPSSANEVEGLEVAAVWDKEHIVRRIEGTFPGVM